MTRYRNRNGLQTGSWIRPVLAILVILMVLALPARHASAQQVDLHSGHYVHQSCELGKKSVPHEAFCIGFLIGTVDTLFRSGAICERPNIDRNKAFEVIKRFLKDHPEDRELPAATLAAIALIEAFPCQ